MIIQIELDCHCIETAIKKKYERLIQICLSESYKNSESKSIESEIEIFRYILENADFLNLRYSQPGLNGGTGNIINLNIPENRNDITLCLNGKIIPFIWKQPKSNIRQLGK